MDTIFDHSIHITTKQIMWQKICESTQRQQKPQVDMLSYSCFRSRTH